MYPMSMHSNFIKQTLLDLKPQEDLNTMIVGDLDTPLSPKDRTSRQKTKQNKKHLHKETSKLNDSIDQTDLIDIYTFFSAAHGTFSKTDHILGHNASLNKYNKIKITPWILLCTME
jgi:hypothetical protein